MTPIKNNPPFPSLCPVSGRNKNMDAWENEIGVGGAAGLTFKEGESGDDDNAPAEEAAVVAPVPVEEPVAAVKRKDPPGDEFPWQEVPASDAGVKKSLKEIEAFWTHGMIKTSQVEVAKVRTRGSRKTKTNTDYEMDVRVEAVLYKCHIKG